MSQTTRAFAGFLMAPPIPGALLYIYGVFKGYGDAAVVGPFIITFLGYVAMLVFGIPAYMVLQRKHMRSLSAYIFAGALVGAVFDLVFEILTTYPGQLVYRLHYLPAAALLAAAYASVAAASFWLIAGISKTKPSATRGNRYQEPA
jgi:hypothetical protein